MDLHHIREDYTQKVLSIQDCHANPLSQFEQWLSEALNAKVSEPTAMNVATVAEIRSNCLEQKEFVSRKITPIDEKPR